MDSITRKILLENDEIGCFEIPTNFNYRKLSKQVAKLKKELEMEFKLEFKLDDQVQDASFHCDLAIPFTLITDQKKNQGYSIRVSNFGNMITIFRENDLEPEYIPKLKKIISKNGFKYISPSYLEENYDGLFEGFRSMNLDSSISWSLRYFNYL